MLRHVSRTSAIATAAAVALGLTLTATAAAAPVTAALGASARQQSGPPVRTDPNNRYTAEEIRRFLTSFYGKHGPSAWQREHQVSAELKKKAAETPDYDLLLCAQNTPRDISVGKVTTAQSARVGWATITTHWSGNRTERFTAYVDLDATRPIELLDVACSM
ncbi:hypothetical protein ACH4OW_13345 [Streptomyces sp. NPDC017056]|uniref:hypothetical protein n=1 Tax=Streptomyces sp. NPDC017056 TaxID=3364973 RepID=UPI003793D642